jgi:hypothetical protein
VVFDTIYTKLALHHLTLFLHKLVLAVARTKTIRTLFAYVPFSHEIELGLAVVAVLLLLVLVLL